MIRSASVRLGVSLGVGLVALQLAGCGSTLKPDRTAQTVTDFVASQTGFKPTDVTCPSGVKAEVGREFDCHFTGPEGPYTAHLKITKVNGEDISFDIQSRRS